MLEQQLGPLFDFLGLSTLVHHWHVIMLSAFGCSLIYHTSDALSPLVAPNTFNKLKGFKRANWNMHVVSLIHCLVVIVGAVTILWDSKLQRDRVFGYNSWAGNVYAFTCGYFFWDVCTSLKHWREQGIGFFFHAISCFIVFILSFRPILNYYGAVFLMYELSTPFLNFNWFMDKLGMTGSVAQLINGIFLLVSFLCARLIFGFYMSYRTFVDVSAVIDRVPIFICVIYGVANVILNSLNVYWYRQMIKALFRRFEHSPLKPDSGESEALSSAGAGVAQANGKPKVA